MKRIILKLMASAVILGAVGIAAATDVTPKMLRQASKAADDAMVAIKKHQRDEAVRYAERAVLYNPASADNRALLGQAYLQAGRFISSETAFSDALRLDPNHGRAALGLGLVQVALSKNRQALATLEQARGHVPDVDLGLALALAGDRQGAISILEPTARATGATPKARQNLALAYAIAGRWAEARVTAAQDVSPDKLEQRMSEWAHFVRPRGSADQLSALIGVKSVMDAGMPAQLALLDAQPAAAPAAVAAVEPQPIPVQKVAKIAAQPIADVAPQPAEAVAVAAPVGKATPVVAESAPVVIPTPVAEPVPTPQVVEAFAPEPVRNEKPMFVTVTAQQAPVATTDSKPRFIKAVPVPPSRPMVVARTNVLLSDATYVIQLGAFSSQDRLENAWSGAVTRVSWLKDYAPVSTTFARPQDNRTLYRLAISGFTSRIEAVNVCRKVREHGTDCFVRGKAGDAPVQWVSRKAAPVYAAR